MKAAAKHVIKSERNLAPASAQEVGLKYVTDDMPGIVRIKKGKGFLYKDQFGHLIKDKSTIQRIKSLAIPPAYIDVWICPNPNGHLQATGRDARGRKQYRYHTKWREIRDKTKYDRMLSFGQALPLIRARVQKDLRLEGLPKDKVLATVIGVMEKTFIRVGNDEYAKDNDSYGLTTMQDKHAKATPSKVIFTFRGKSGIKHSLTLDDPKLSKIIKKCQDLPGQELFQYQDEQGIVHDITSADVNDYLRRITGEDFTAKDFRTWHGTVLAVSELKNASDSRTKKELKRNLLEAIECVSKYLGNTKAICRKCYIHPSVMESYLSGTFKDSFIARKRVMARKMSDDEISVVAFLKNSIT